MSGKLAFSMSTRAGCVDLLKEGYRYRGSRVIRADNPEDLRLRADAAVKNGNGYRWVTMNGSHVLIRGNEIVGGAGGRLNGTASRPRKSGGKAGSGAARIESVGEMKAALERAGFKNVDMESFANRGFDEKLLVENANRLLELERRFGAAKGLGMVVLWGDDGFFLGAKGAREGAAAAVSGTHTLRQLELKLSNAAYGLRERHIKDREREAGTGQSMPCAPSGYATYIITHEYGHIIQALLYREEYKKHGWSPENPNALLNLEAKTKKAALRKAVKTQLEVNRRAFTEIQEIGKRKDPSFSLVAQLSKYGRTSYSEALAELFANSQCGAPNAGGEAMSIWLREKGFSKE